MLPRLTLARRLTWALAAMAIATSALAVTVQDRALSRDLRLAAEQRLARAASAANQLVDNHLAALQARYRTVSGTPQLRAALELADAPTLAFFAGELREREQAALVAFADAAGAAPIQPLTKLDSSLTRNAITLATSSGLPVRRTGVFLAALALNSSQSIPMRSAVCCVMRVSMNPGATALTLIPNGPSSMASVRVKPCKPALAVE